MPDETLGATVKELGQEVEQLETRPATLSEWRRLSSEVFIAILRSQRELIRCQREMIERVKAVSSDGAWRGPHRDVAAIHRALHLLR